MRIILVGNPNCGKTTLFNALTGDDQRVGNWPGVTVEKKTGCIKLSDSEKIYISDLPGIYTLTATPDGSSIDEKIAAAAIAKCDADMILNVIDASNLERHLYLSSQLLELGKPMIVVLNMSDLAEKRGIKIDINLLSSKLNCPVVALQAHKEIGLTVLKQAILSHSTASIALDLALSKSILTTLNYISAKLSAHNYAHASYTAYRILEGDNSILDAVLGIQILAYMKNLVDIDITIADARYRAIHQITSLVQTKNSDANEHFTAKIDRIVLHRFWALPIFFTLMYTMFYCALKLSSIFQDFFSISTDAIFVQGSAYLLQQLHAPNYLNAIIAEGIGKGINTTASFIPVLGSMFFFLALLESSGYMARAAFVVDRAMRALGLPGKAFVPMIVGFGCNVPAIMAARTLDAEQDRLLTILMSPFMSCSARLSIYAAFVTVFFEAYGANIVFSLYLIGIFMAVLTGLLLRKTMFQGQASPLILELPAYHKPSMHRLIKETLSRLHAFVWRAAKMIIPVCIIIGGLNALTLPNDNQSLLAIIARYLSPIFNPMGLSGDNWPATVALLSGTLAKEVVIGSLNTLYAHMNEPISTHLISVSDILSLLNAACMSITHNLSQLIGFLQAPINPTEYGLTLSNRTLMYQYFDGKIGAYAYLLFILLYIPCVSTMAAIRQEASRKLMYFSIIWSIVIAYTTATSFYQLATIMRHPYSSMAWVIFMLSIILGAILLLRSTNSNKVNVNVIGVA